MLEFIVYSINELVRTAVRMFFCTVFDIGYDYLEVDQALAQECRKFPVQSQQFCANELKS